MIFVDTGVWFAMAVPTDRDHQLVAGNLAQLKEPLFTTDYIVDETLTLLRARGYERRAIAIGQEFFNGSIAELYHLSDEDVRAAWGVYRRYDDKKWSFTDCTSKVIVEKLSITTALSLDHHFKQFGSVQVLP